MSVLCDLLKIIKTAQYAQNTIKCNVNFRRKCYVNCFLQKEFCKNVIDIYLMAL